MPTNPNNKSANQRFTAWLNQGLKRQNWSARRVAQMGLLIALGVVVAALYLVQSSQIVTSTRQVQQLREDLAELQQANADLTMKISIMTTRAQLQQRAETLGFASTGNLWFVAVPHLPQDDSPSIEYIYAPSVSR
jgi:cell division protein FtsB